MKKDLRETCGARRVTDIKHGEGRTPEVKGGNEEARSLKFSSKSFNIR